MYAESLCEFAFASKSIVVSSDKTVQKYLRFMHMLSEHHEVQVVPVDDITIIWQAHMARPNDYAACCLKMYGRIVDMHIRVKNPQKSMEYTTSVWKDKFNEEYKSNKKQESVLMRVWKWLFDPESDINPSWTLQQ